MGTKRINGELNVMGRNVARELSILDDKVSALRQVQVTGSFTYNFITQEGYPELQDILEESRFVDFYTFSSPSSGSAVAYDQKGIMQLQLGWINYNDTRVYGFMGFNNNNIQILTDNVNYTIYYRYFKTFKV